MTIKVLHIITTLRRGGAERQLVNLVSNTNRAEFEHVVCYLRPPIDFAAEIERAGHKVIDLNVRARHPWIAGPLKFASLVRSERPDFVQTWLYDATIVARLAQLLTRKRPRLLDTLHSTNYDADTIRAYGHVPRKVNMLRLVDKWTARIGQSMYLPVSQTVADSNILQLSLPPERMRVMYNSIDPSSLACEEGAPEQLRREFGIPNDALVFLNVGSMDLSKGQEGLLRAFTQVADAEPRAYLMIVGDGTLMSELRLLADQLGVASRVRFAGQRSDIGACLEMADVFVFPSLVEGLPIAPLEAMMKALPCVASRIKPLREVFRHGETGLLVTPGSADELAAAMIDLARDPMRRKALGEQAREEAMRRFHCRTAIFEWEELYRQAAMNGRANQ